MSRTNEKKWTAKSMAGYLNTLVFLNESTDDHLYLWELAEDRLRFASQISEKFALPEREEGYLMEEWLEIVYFRDGAALKNQSSSSSGAESWIPIIRSTAFWIAKTSGSGSGQDRLILAWTAAGADVGLISDRELEHETGSGDGPDEHGQAA